MKIAIQGIHGSFHHEVALKLYGSDATIVECITFDEVFASVDTDNADTGIVAIENSLQGSINQTYRLLSKTGLKIVAEYYLPVNQYLIGTQNGNVASLNNSSTKIYSMFPAFAQVENWLENNLPLAEKVEYFDTSASVQKIMGDMQHNELAIAGKLAAEYHGATIITGPINDHKDNKTRFFVIKKLPEYDLKGDKTSIILTTDHAAGALYKALGVFEQYKVNLTKLDSYPIPGDKWHYMFYIDFESGYQDKKTKSILNAMAELGYTVKVLGSY